MITLTIIAVSIAALTNGVPIDTVLDWLVKVAPLLAALGLFEIAATIGRSLWAKFKIAAGKSPTKVDDFLVHVLDAPVTAALDALKRGDTDTLEKKLRAIESLIPKR